jgi:hypothetical protein
MNWAVLSWTLAAALGAGARLETWVALKEHGDLARSFVPAGGEALFGIVREGTRYSLVRWEIANGARTALIERADCMGFDASPDGRSVCVASGTRRGEYTYDVDLAVWEADARPVARLASRRPAAPGTISNAAFSADGSIIAIADGLARRVNVWRREAGTRWVAVKSLPVAEAAGAPATGLSLATTADGKQLFLFFLVPRGQDAALLVGEKWDVGSARRLQFPFDALAVTAPPVGFYGTPLLIAGGTLCVGSFGEEMTGIDVSSGTREYVNPCGARSPTVSPDGATGAALEWQFALPGDPSVPEAAVNFWAFSDGSRRRRVAVPHGATPPIGVFGADSRYFVCAAGADNRTVYLVDVEAGGIRRSWLARAPVSSLSVLATGEVAVVGSEGGTILIHRVAPR